MVQEHSKALGALISCVLLLCSSCVTTSSDTETNEVTIVERSKGIEPLWVRQLHVGIALNQGQWQFVDKKTNISNLALGLKQTQIYATEHHSIAFADLIKNEISELAKKNGIEFEANNLLVEKHVLEISRAICEKYRVVQDIYYEGHKSKAPLLERVSSEISYTVYVQIVMPEEVYREAVWKLGDKLISNKSEKIQQIGHLIKAKYPKTTGFG